MPVTVKELNGYKAVGNNTAHIRDSSCISLETILISHLCLTFPFMKLNRGRKVESIGRKDDYQSDFYEDEARFADVVNGVLFHGKDVVKPEELEEADSVIASVLDYGRGDKVICDKVRRWKGRYFSIMVLENQSYVDYRMVLRTMRAEVIGYERQRKRAYLGAMRRGEVISKDEFLSKTLKETKYTPIIILVLYMGRMPWDGARSLHELLEIEEELKPFISDYKLNLYDYHEHSDFSVFKTENRALFEVLSCLGDERKMGECPAMHEHLDEESIKAILGITGVQTKLKRLFVGKGEGGKKMYQLCKAFADHMETGRQEGRKQGRQEGRKQSRLEALRNLMESLNIPLEEAMELLKIPLEDKEQYKSLR